MTTLGQTEGRGFFPPRIFFHSTTGGTFWCKGGKREREARRERGREREGDKQCTHSRLRPALSLPPASHNSIVFLLQRKTQLQLNLDVERVTTVSKKSCSVMEWEESWSFIYLFGFLINSDSNFSSSLQNEIDRKVDENWSTKFYENAETSRPVQERFQKNSWFFKMRRWFFFQETEAQNPYWLKKRKKTFWLKKKFRSSNRAQDGFAARCSQLDERELGNLEAQDPELVEKLSGKFGSGPGPEPADPHLLGQRLGGSVSNKKSEPIEHPKLFKMTFHRFIFWTIVIELNKCLGPGINNSFEALELSPT